MKRIVRSLLRRAGYEVLNMRNASSANSLPEDFSPEEIQTYLKVRPYTLTPAERVVSLIRATEYVVGNNIPGAFVECGVWNGGSAMTMALTLVRLNRADREIFLYDTWDQG